MDLALNWLCISRALRLALVYPQIRLGKAHAFRDPMITCCGGSHEQDGRMRYGKLSTIVMRAHPQHHERTVAYFIDHWSPLNANRACFKHLTEGKDLLAPLTPRFSCRCLGYSNNSMRVSRDRSTICGVRCTML